MANELPPVAKNIVGYAELVSGTLALVATFCTATVLGRALGQDPIEVLKFKVPLSYIAAVIGVCTVAHAFWGFFILKGFVNFQKHLQSEETKVTSAKSDSPVSTQMLFDEIRTNKKVFLRGLMPRTLEDGSRIAKMSVFDPTTWLSYGLALLTIIAILPWRIDHGLRWASPEVIIIYAGVALVLGMINWWVGGLWIISLSRLTNDPTANLEQLEFTRRNSTDLLAKVGGFAWSVLNLLFWPAVICGIVIGLVYLFHGKVAAWVIIAATIVVIFIIFLGLVSLFSRFGGSSSVGFVDESPQPNEAEDQA